MSSGVGGVSGAGGSGNSSKASSKSSELSFGEFMQQTVLPKDMQSFFAMYVSDDEKPVKVRPPEGFNTIDYSA